MAEVVVTLVRRIDRNTVCGTSDEILEMVMKDKNKTHYLYRVGGSAVGSVTGNSKFGEWIKLVGRFKALNWKQQAFKSGAAFLPGDVASMIADKLAGDNESVNFLFDVYARYDSTIGPKYGYIVEPVQDPTVGDPLDALFEKAPMPQLADQSAKE